MDQEIVDIYRNFIEEMHRASADDARHFRGLIRLFSGRQSGADRLLPGFDAAVEAYLGRLPAQHVSSPQVRELGDWMLEQFCAQREHPRIRYALMAAQRHLLPLVPLLCGEDAAYLWERYERAIPRSERFPSHEELIAKLKERSRAGNLEQAK